MFKIKYYLAYFNKVKMFTKRGIRFIYLFTISKPLILLLLLQ